jgi:hypothetical protein
MSSALPITVNGELLALYSPDGPENVRCLARDIVKRGSIGANTTVDICAALIVAHVIEYPGKTILSMTTDVAYESKALLERYDEKASAWVTHAADVSLPCAAILVTGLAKYHDLTGTERANIVTELQTDAKQYEFANGILVEDVTATLPPLASKWIGALAVALAIVGISKIPAFWPLGALLVIVIAVASLMPRHKQVHRCRSATEVMSMIRRRSDAKVRALNVVRTLIQELLFEEVSVKSWMGQPRLDVECANVCYIGILGCVEGQHCGRSAEYRFYVTLNVYEDAPLEQQRSAFRSELFRHLVKARHELAKKLEIVD